MSKAKVTVLTARSEATAESLKVSLDSNISSTVKIEDRDGNCVFVERDQWDNLKTCIDILFDESVQKDSAV